MRAEVNQAFLVFEAYDTGAKIYVRPEAITAVSKFTVQSQGTCCIYVSGAEFGVRGSVEDVLELLNLHR